MRDFRALTPRHVRELLAQVFQRRGDDGDEMGFAEPPLGRRLEPEEIASLVAYLASEGARAIHGQCINVCGGRLLC